MRPKPGKKAKGKTRKGKNTKRTRRSTRESGAGKRGCLPDAGTGPSRKLDAIRQTRAGAAVRFDEALMVGGTGIEPVTPAV